MNGNVAGPGINPTQASASTESLAEQRAEFLVKLSSLLQSAKHAGSEECISIRTAIVPGLPKSFALAKAGMLNSQQLGQIKTTLAMIRRDNDTQEPNQLQRSAQGSPQASQSGDVMSTAIVPKNKAVITLPRQPYMGTVEDQIEILSNREYDERSRKNIAR
ncbi:unnamed protein product [Rhizoctonia solani]|uniref:Uncharacterized protein n=1 Tax=Rhizoctonia solani TaxID=456999 RepID=A0A8H3GDP3_9AGAM